MVRYIGNRSSFVKTIGPYQLTTKPVDWEGDDRQRQMSGKQILSPRARILNHLEKKRFDPIAEQQLSQPAYIKRNVDDRGISRPPTGHSKMFPG